MKSPAICFLPILVLTARLVHGQSTVDPAKASSWAANAGWINWRPNQPAPSGGGVIGEAVLAGKIYSANCGWIDLGDGAPVNGIAYQNNSASDCGVNVSPDGTLTGFAYGANIGWINFEQTFGKPKFDLLTGLFSGFAYGANIGWINLGTGDLRTTTIKCTDTDGDGIGDEWEIVRFGNLTTATLTSDFDKDGVSDHHEYAALTDPKDGKSFLRITGIVPSPSLQGLFVLTFGPTGQGRTYRVEHSPNLQAWTAITGLESFLPDAGAATQRTVPFTGNSPPPFFFRVRVSKPLQP